MTPDAWNLEDPLGDVVPPFGSGAYPLPIIDGKKDMMTHLNSWASGPHSRLDRFIARIGNRMESPLAILFEDDEVL